MIFLEEPNCYKGSHEFRIFEEEFEIDLSNQIAFIRVFLQESVDSRIPNLVLCVIDSMEDARIEDIIRQTLLEIVLPEHWMNYKVIVTKEYDTDIRY